MTTERDAAGARQGVAGSADRLVSVRKIANVLGFSPETLRQIAQTSETLYKPFLLSKGVDANGKQKMRPIDRPVGVLKAIQSRINRRLLAGIQLPKEFTGGVPKRSTVSNARPHVRQAEIATLDVKEYFESIRAAQVAQAIADQLKTGRETTWLLTRLTTYQNRLPQGAPTSSALANLVFLPVAAEIRKLCGENGWRFTVYVDDLTVSGPRARESIESVVRILMRNGLGASRKKTRVMPRSGHQEVTGIVVNKKVSNGRRRMRAIGQEIFLASRGLGPLEIGRLAGTAAYARHISRSQGERVQERLAGVVAASAKGRTQA